MTCSWAPSDSIRMFQGSVDLHDMSELAVRFCALADSCALSDSTCSSVQEVRQLSVVAQAVTEGMLAVGFGGWGARAMGKGFGEQLDPWDPTKGFGGNTMCR